MPSWDGVRPWDGSAHPAPRFATRTCHTRAGANAAVTAPRAAEFPPRQAVGRLGQWTVKIDTAVSAWTRPASCLRPNRHEKAPAAKTAGAQRRVIEGEGLGGFARRHPVNDSIGGLFLLGLQFFLQPSSGRPFAYPGAPEPKPLRRPGRRLQPVHRYAARRAAPHNGVIPGDGRPCRHGPRPRTGRPPES
jgi:hypothetical protein